MISNKKISPLKKICLKLKLRRLEAHRSQEVSDFIAMNPSRASKMDNIEKNLTHKSFQDTVSKIRAIKRILKIK